ncbi:MAG: hypothetical protein ACPHK8_02600 [Thermoplasmatota archaeon]
MTALPRVVLLLLLAVLVPLGHAAEPTDAAALWNAEHGTDLVAALTFPEQLVEGQQFEATLQLRGDVSEVRYQICNIGQVCWVTNVPVERSGNNWTLATAAIPQLQPEVRDKPIHFEAGNRVGVQYFVTIGNETLLFPHGDECDVLASDAEWLACQETHYFGVNVVAAEKATPPVALPLVMLAFLLVARRV